jgi:hypothetical protein
MALGCNVYERRRIWEHVEASVSAGRILGNGNSSLGRKADIKMDR